MWDDPIVSEVRRARQAHAAKFNHDLRAIYQDLREKEASSGRKYVRFPARRLEVAGAPVSAQGG